MRKTGWRLVQGIIAIVVLFFLVRHFLDIWHKAQDQPVQWSFHWEFIAASFIITWAMYGALIWGWRTVLEGWREWLRIVDAARIWTVSNLGTFIPGGVWSIAGMAVMAQQRGVSGAAATSSAIVMQLVSLATGVILAIALIGTPILDRVLGDWGTIAGIGIAAGTLVCAVALTSPSLTRRLSFLVGRPDLIRPVDPTALAGALFANLTAWAGYGIALQLLALGTLHGVELSWTVATGAFAGAYVAGYVFVLLPAGFGMREAVMATILISTGIPAPSALALVAASRVILTVNQVGAALPFLLFRSRLSDIIKTD
jgi:glycosyltransferase 2 family protein